MAERSRRSLTIALSASLIANIFLVGLVVGVFVREPPFGHRRAMTADFMALPETSRAVAREAFNARSGELRDKATALRRAQRQAAQVIAADPLDQSAAEAALKDLRERSVAMQAVLHDAFLNAAKSLAPADRERMIRSLFLAPGYGIPLARLGPAEGSRWEKGS